jgi:hypothetical protein
MHNPDVSHDVSRTRDHGVNDARRHALARTAFCQSRNAIARAATSHSTRPKPCGKPCELVFATTNFWGIRLTILWTGTSSAPDNRENRPACSQPPSLTKPSKSVGFEGVDDTYQQFGTVLEGAFRVKKLCKNPCSGYIHDVCNHLLHQSQQMMKGGECGDNTHEDQRRPICAGHVPQHRVPPHRLRALRTRLCGISDAYRRRIRPGLHHAPSHGASNVVVGR